MKNIFYFFVKTVISVGLFFYTKRIIVKGEKNIPKKGAILFMANHPNALIDPLIIATSTKRKTHFLVRAAVFKKTIIAKIFGLLGMMPIYRIRDGLKEISKNDAIFEQCVSLFKSKKAILIFPEGSHNIKRTIRPLSKGFTRILFRALDKHKDLEIHIVPIGLTYQNESILPTKVAVNIGKPILTSSFYNPNEINNSVNKLKEQVSNQLKELSAHIDAENYEETVTKLNAAQVDFTDTETVNWIVKKKTFPPIEKPKREFKFIKLLLIINSIFAYIIWKKTAKKIPEIEFVDTFRFGLNLVLIPFFYSLQALIISYLFGNKIGVIYFLTSLILVLIYTKLSPTNTES
ncbi:acyltransferase [Tenacibaculum todarodis]|uniref:Acyltransferase n=1 Tax=Tenacibaculum todarodis TaxID=1850252 RepID=A0A1L3JFU6_9FLAO|nr:lysophospholipid acyltransferase family protein [Tenacibaculum todarodis]APG64015.1 acyltransferase [Tenacibaculum todarodis]